MDAKRPNGKEALNTPSAMTSWRVPFLTNPKPEVTSELSSSRSPLPSAISLSTSGQAYLVDNPVPLHEKVGSSPQRIFVPFSMFNISLTDTKEPVDNGLTSSP